MRNRKNMAMILWFACALATVWRAKHDSAGFLVQSAATGGRKGRGPEGWQWMTTPSRARVPSDAI
jgi:hypothetical protein